MRKCGQFWGTTKSVEFEPFPLFDASHVTETIKDYPVSFNGKMRFTLKLSLSLSIDEIKEIVINEERTQNQLQGNSSEKGNCCSWENNQYSDLMSNDILVEVVGLVGATFTTLAFVPQVVKIWKNRSSDGVSLSMYVCMLVGIIIWLAYGILIDSIAVIAANILSGILQVVIIFLTLKNRTNN